MKFRGVVCIAFVIVLVSFLAPTKAALEDKVACKSTELTECIPEGQTGSQPSAKCCGKLKGEKSCLCTFIRSRVFPPENIYKLLAGCGIPRPTCVNKYENLM
ncbi:hypothetical protein N665_0085s0020 [Sinapis alba]|nr:hypothetical protein N665_0085s0020 [Sinapis alba]